MTGVIDLYGTQKAASSMHVHTVTKTRLALRVLRGARSLTGSPERKAPLPAWVGAAPLTHPDAYVGTRDQRSIQARPSVLRLRVMPGNASSSAAGHSAGPAGADPRLPMSPARPPARGSQIPRWTTSSHQPMSVCLLPITRVHGNGPDPLAGWVLTGRPAGRSRRDSYCPGIVWEPTLESSAA